jgi:hypothetical protein
VTAFGPGRPTVDTSRAVMLTESTVVILESTPTNGVALLLGLILDLVNVIRRDDELGDGRLAAEMRRLLGDLWAEHP